jgi:hypothetical protein
MVCGACTGIGPLPVSEDRGQGAGKPVEGLNERGTVMNVKAGGCNTVTIKMESYEALALLHLLDDWQKKLIGTPDTSAKRAMMNLHGDLDNIYTVAERG